MIRRFLVQSEALQLSCQSVPEQDIEPHIAPDVAPSVYDCVWMVNATDAPVR